ncbi:hypothetical protein [Paenibacillus tuaregi]|uniref:hypothetical protein n=1 Tax=Paenibacillus tuaregi TaxID=1816681 RepID=UPI000838C661|nr:hypothetical protein [Paenibacillus tuaregi]
MMTDSSQNACMQKPGSREIVRTGARHWRVGSVSMGVSLLILGIVILYAEYKGMNGLAAAKAWWPIYFILLGLEIMAHTVFRRNTRIHYDMIGIILMGILWVCSQATLFFLGQ